MIIINNDIVYIFCTFLRIADIKVWCCFGVTHASLHGFYIIVSTVPKLRRPL